MLHWTAALHHDGSSLYVSNLHPALGQTVRVRLRGPLNAPIRSVWLRTAPDGEEHIAEMKPDGQQGISRYWAADILVSMPRMTYRFKLLTDEGAYWVTGLGVSRADSPDSFDFKLIAGFRAPLWATKQVFYQIFPDRFHNGDPSNDVPEGLAWGHKGHLTQRRAWGAPPLPWAEAGSQDYYGGDLPGITQKLDYLTDLGVTALFLNPIFTAYSNHRYDIADYHHVDPHLGGDAALADLRRALDARGMKLILDVTPNHCGWKNEWFTAAQHDPKAPSADYFTFRQRPDQYESWLGHPTLPKLNYQSERLRDAMYRKPEAVMQKWLAEPYRADGWRLDVANMTARQGTVQLAHDVWKEMRRALKSRYPASYVFGENFFDGTPHLQGDELDAVMNYQGFTIPLWGWLQNTADESSVWARWVDPFPLPAEALAEQWARFRSMIPWAITQQQFNLLGCHDTPRIRWLLKGDRQRVKLATTLLLTFPGVPSIYYGDEIGMDGGADPDNRRCMPWNEAQWDKDLRAHHQHLIALRKTAPALLEGGFQMLYAQGSTLAYLRESADQRLLVIGQRGPDALTDVKIPVWHGGYADGAVLNDLLGAGSFHVVDGALVIEHLPAGAALVLTG